MWKLVWCSITLLVLSVCGEITVVNNEYKGIVIAMRDDLQETDCNKNFDSIKNLLGNASELMYSATGDRLSFGEVLVVVPESWSCDGNAKVSEGIRLTDAHVRVGPSHPVFGNNPWTQQPRGCGDQGDFIYIPEGYLNSPSDTYGAPAQVFVHEWAKFRWGVFEESGHSGDSMFPPSYRVLPNDSLTLQPNYCTDKPVLGKQSCTETDTTDEKDCIFTPNTNSSNYGITSSLLSVPFLKNVVNFCNSSTHKSDLPTKQNFICDGKSAWEVIESSQDISENPSTKEVTAPLFRLLKAAPAFTEKIVIAVEHSNYTAMNGDTWEFLRDTVRQFIELKFESKAAVGLIIFSDTVEKQENLTVLSSIDERKKLSDLVPDDESTSTKTKNLQKTISSAAALLNNDGVIILMTANQEKLGDDPESLVSAADGNAVWPILFPNIDGIDTTVYETLAKNTGGVSFNITSTVHYVSFLFKNYQDVNNYHDLSLKMLQVQSDISIREAPVEVDSKICEVQNQECTIKLEVNDPVPYDDEYIIEVYSATLDNAKADAENSETEVMAELNTYKAYKIKKETSNSFTIKVSRKALVDIIKVTLMATKKLKSSDYSVTVSASSSLENLHYTSNTAPVIYAQVNKNWDLVYFASVIATVNSKNLSLHDNGVGADVTGNDGVYSAYLLGITNTGKVDIAFTVGDNNGNAKLIESKNKAVPSNTTGKWCCGSEIDLSDVNLVKAVNLSIISTTAKGTVTGNPGEDLPPGHVTDLTAAVVGTNNGAEITLNFTATGGDLDQGKVSYYKVKRGTQVDRTCGNNTESGTRITFSFTTEIPTSDTLYTYHLEAVDDNGKEGKPSNKVRVLIPANIEIPIDPTGLGAGAIAGIVIGVLLLVILVILGVMLFLGKDNKEESFAWNMVLCKCCKKEEEDNIYNKDPPTSARSNDVIRNPTVEPIRSIEDLYAKPDMDAKKRNKTEKIEDEYDDEDGGFTSHRSQSNDIPLQNNYAKKNTVERSSQQNLPINQVGIPIPENPSLQRNQGGNIQSNERNTYNQRYSSNQNYGGNNNAYDASYDYGANYSQPQTGRAPQTLTQV